MSLLCVEAVPTIPGRRGAKRCSLPWRLFFFFLLLCFLAPCGKFFVFLSWQRGLLGSFGTVQVPWSYQRSRSQAGERRGGEGKGRSGARHCRPQHPGNWQSGTSDHSETGFHTHGWMNKNAGTKEEKKKNTAAAIFNYRRMKPTTLH